MSLIFLYFFYVHFVILMAKYLMQGLWAKCFCLGYAYKLVQPTKLMNDADYDISGSLFNFIVLGIAVVINSNNIFLFPLPFKQGTREAYICGLGTWWSWGKTVLIQRVMSSAPSQIFGDISSHRLKPSSKFGNGKNSSSPSPLIWFIAQVKL